MAVMSLDLLMEALEQEEKTGGHRCHHCLHVFSYRCNLNRHLQSAADKSYKCPHPHCSRFFIYRKLLIRHLASRHELIVIIDE